MKFPELSNIFSNITKDAFVDYILITNDMHKCLR